jgi:hypothetical protein
MLNSFTDDPVWDAQRYYKGLEEQFDKENREEHCEVCGKACARLKHYDFDGVIVCDDCLYEAFKRQLIPEDILDDMAYDYGVQR